jgi:phage gp29-like protein
MADKPILYGPDNQPIKRELLTQEIAAPTITGVRTPFTGYPGDGLNPRRLASLLREADQGEPLRYFELAEQIEERDLHYAGVLATRKRSVAQLDVTVEAASDAAEHIRHADMVRSWLSRDELQDEIFDMLDAIGKGVSYTEIIWDTSEGQWWPKCLEWRDPRWFRPDRVNGVTPLLRTETGDVPLPPMKFICAVIRAKSGLPVRSGLARLATWSWMFKAFTLRDWAIFTQTFGQPIRIGKYGPGATEADKDTLYRAVANIAGDCAAIVPASMTIEFVESKNVTSGTDLYVKRAEYLDQQVSKAVLGQTATTDAVVGGLGSGKEHRQVQEDIERADAKSLSAILNRDLIRAWVDLEAGPQKLYPKLRIGRADERDIEKTVDSITKLVPFGLRVEKSWAADMLGVPDPDPEAELLVAPRAPAPIGLGNLALTDAGNEPPARTLHAANPAQRASDAIDHLATEAEDVVAPGADALIDTVRRLVERASSLQEVRDGLRDLKFPEEKFAGLMRMALAFANLSGRAEIADG